MGDARLWILVLPVCLSGLMVAATLAGRRLAGAQARHGDGGQSVGIGAIDAAVLGLLGLLVGHDMGARGPIKWLHTLVFAAVVSLTIWVIYDLEVPRFGLIRVDDYDRLLRDLRDEFSGPASPVGPVGDAPPEPVTARPAGGLSG